MKLVVFLLLSAVAFAQPDAPQPQPKRTGPWAPWDYSHPNLTIGQTFKSPWFLGTVGTAEVSYWADVGFSLAAIHRGCIEGNPDLPAHPVLGDYAENWAKTELPLDIFQWSLIKLNRKPTKTIAILMPGVRVGVHMNGVAIAMRCR